jgi:predicted amidophosphoribosyltransferase
VNVTAWCGTCGEAFPLIEAVHGVPGRCPRCGQQLAPDYTAVLAATIGQLVSAAAALEGATRQLHQIAPSLHVDRRRIAADLDAAAES